MKKYEAMVKEIIEKISSYNLFNYLLPGVIYAVLGEQLTDFNLILDNLILALFLFYFIGMIISRFGSLVIYPSLKHLGIIKFKDYEEYVSASKKDLKIEVFLEVANTYRTMIALFFMTLVTVLFEYVMICYNLPIKSTMVSLLVLLFFVFIVAYWKQVEVIKKRIDKANKNT